MSSFCLCTFLTSTALILAVLSFQVRFRKTTFDVLRFNSDNLEVKSSWVTSSGVSCGSFCISQVEGSTRRKIAQYSSQSSLCQCFDFKNKHLTYFSMMPKVTDTLFMYHRELYFRNSSFFVFCVKIN